VNLIQLSPLSTMTSYASSRARHLTAAAAARTRTSDDGQTVCVPPANLPA